MYPVCRETELSKAGCMMVRWKQEYEEVMCWSSDCDLPKENYLLQCSVNRNRQNRRLEFSLKRGITGRDEARIDGETQGYGCLPVVMKTEWDLCLFQRQKC